MSTDEFGEWWDGLTIEEQDKIQNSVKLIEEFGPTLDFLHTSDVAGSRHSKRIGGRRAVAKKFSELQEKLYAKMTAEQRAASRREYERLLAEMPLHKLRKARNLTQEGLARVLDVNQSEISKIEKRTDVYVSTLAGYVKAMGGRLEISAVFPDGEAVRISQFEEIGNVVD